MKINREKAEHLFKTALWCLAAMFCYRVTLFRSLPHKTYDQSKAV